MLKIILAHSPLLGAYFKTKV